MNLHQNARTTPHSRRLMVRRVLDQKQSASRVAADFGVSERTVRKWLARWRGGGEPALNDRSSAPARQRRLPSEQVAAIEALRRQRLTSPAIAREVGLSIPAVGHWRKRFLEQGLAGLYGEQRPGRPRSHDDEAVASLLATVLQSRPSVGTHWTLRGAAEATGISKSTVQRYLRLFGVHPHRSKTFKLSTDPLFVEKVRDIVGLYLNPPDHAVVLCVDEKSQIQALERTQPILPMGSATSTASPTTISGTARPRCLPPSMSPTGRYWRSAGRATAIRNSWRSSNASMPPCLLGSTSTSSSTTTPPTSTRRSALGSPSGRASMSTTRRPTRRG